MLLGQAGMESVVCRDLPALIAHLDDNVGFVLLTEDAVRNADLLVADGPPPSRHGPTCHSFW